MAEEETPRDYRWAIPLVVIGAIILGVDWVWAHPTPIGFVITGLAVGAVFFLFFLGLSYNGPHSKLYGLKPVTSRMPAVAQPKGHVHFRTKMFWTIIILLLYFLLTNIF